MKTIRMTHVPDESKIDKRAAYDIFSENPDSEKYEQQTDRNIGWIRREDQTHLKNSVVGIAGCGGMGGHVCATLARDGIGEIRLADNDFFEISNSNRQYASFSDTMGFSKAFETARMVHRAAPHIRLKIYPQGITEETVSDFTIGCDTICDEVEFFACDGRILLHETSREHDVPLFNSPTVGHRTYLTKFTKKSVTIEEVLGLSYEDARIFQKKKNAGSLTKAELNFFIDRMLQFAAPDLPEYSKDPTFYGTVSALKERLYKGTASIIAVNPGLAAHILATEVHLNLLLRKSEVPWNFVQVPEMAAYFMYDSALKITAMEKGKWWKH